MRSVCYCILSVLLKGVHFTYFCAALDPSGRIWPKAKSRKFQEVFKVKNRVKTWQVREIWSQQSEHKQVPNRGTEPGVRKGKCSLLACHNRCKCSMETTHISVKVRLGIKVMKLVESLIG